MLKIGVNSLTEQPAISTAVQLVSEAAQLFRNALETEERGLGSEHPKTATTLDLYARLVQSRGDLAAARPLFERALAIREKVCGPEHSDTAISLWCLADLLREEGNFDAARRLCERALAIDEKEKEGQTIPTWRPPFTLSPACSWPRASLQRPSRFNGAR